MFCGMWRSEIQSRFGRPALPTTYYMEGGSGKVRQVMEYAFVTLDFRES